MYVHTSVEARGCPKRSFLIGWDRVSHWTWNSPIQLGPVNPRIRISSPLLGSWEYATTPARPSSDGDVNSGPPAFTANILLAAAHLVSFYIWLFEELCRNVSRKAVPIYTPIAKYKTPISQHTPLFLWGILTILVLWIFSWCAYQLPVSLEMSAQPLAHFKSSLSSCWVLGHLNGFFILTKSLQNRTFINAFSHFMYFLMVTFMILSRVIN